MIEIHDLNMKIRKKLILDHINLTFEPGVYGLLGPNGAGKTTLIRGITGLYPTGKDTVRLNGVENEKIGYLPQQFGMFKGLTAVEMLMYFCELKKIPKEIRREEIERALGQVGLSERKNDKIGSLSGGMIRRVGIAQAFLGSPKLVVLDEPTAGLDPEERVRFKNMISSEAGGKTIILSTHIVEDVAELCDRIIILDEGVVKYMGTGDDVCNLANGKVYRIEAGGERDLKEPYFVQSYDKNEMRIISPIQQNARFEVPSIEDGYLCVTRGYV